MPTDPDIQQRNASNRKARAFLQEVLAGEPQTYQIVHAQAVKQGISTSSLLTAKRRPSKNGQKGSLFLPRMWTASRGSRSDLGPHSLWWCMPI